MQEQIPFDGLVIFQEDNGNYDLTVTLYRDRLGAPYIDVAGENGSSHNQFDSLPQDTQALRSFIQATQRALTYLEAEQ